MTNITVLNISPIEARRIALAEAHVDAAAFTSVTLDGALYELEYETEEMRYTAYVDAESGEVLGFDCAPVPTGNYRSDYPDFDTAA